MFVQIYLSSVEKLHGHKDGTGEEVEREGLSRHWSSSQYGKETYLVTIRFFAVDATTHIHKYYMCIQSLTSPCCRYRARVINQLNFEKLSRTSS